jgi:hypothetical protein
LDDCVRLFNKVEVEVVLAVVHAELPTILYLILYDVTPDDPVHEIAAAVSVTDEEDKFDGVPQVGAVAVVKFAEDVNAELPKEQTD